MTEKRRVTDSVVGVAVLGSIVAEAAGLIAALFGFLSGHFASHGAFFLAAGLSHGSLAIAILCK